MKTESAQTQFCKNEINLIYKYKDKLKQLLNGKYAVFFGSDKTYIGIRNYRFDRDSSKQTKIKPTHIEQTIIFIDNGIWQYSYINVLPHEKGYVSAEAYIKEIVKAIKKTQ